jgi:hypothetical protein
MAIDALTLRLAGVSLRHSSLDIDRALNRIDDAGELREDAVAHELEEAAAMLRYRRFNEFNAVSLDPLKGFGFVLVHQAAVSDNVSGKNCGELALHERYLLAHPYYAEVACEDSDDFLSASPT